MRRLERHQWWLLSLIGLAVISATSQVGLAFPAACCSRSTGQCTQGDPGQCGSSPDPCNGDICTVGPCSGAVGDCNLKHVGCVVVSVTCWDLLGCTPCLLSDEPEDSGDEPVETERSDAEEDPETDGTGTEEEASAPTSLSLGALLVLVAVLLPAAPIMLRRWRRRE